MKKILITGANSYVGTSFEKWLSQWPDEYHVDTIDMIDGTWREKSFTGYDVVFHVAGIAHIKETKENEHLYYEINRDLAYETAQKAKSEGISQFIFMSSMSVYGIDTGIITKDTEPCPKSFYGKAKFEAELMIQPFSNDDFKIVSLRPPMIYGNALLN
ncbi:MAG: NAD-dependent epimerase/dehydratase family protein [Cloacibacillus porcorum]|uniref:NAD-dependent epimerase/dehydratase family protein n=1 Tax=Cloacibacillus porcorum TaxID=1197717 RepID=UPI0023F2AB65|nr:NAD-dependent epimerase/dehydratase family protein [Cloacibacillus porcorum]MCD7877611.1 NAD-dependent epimerase/dehydratase family protein [Cloacibacillus porcorum]